MAELEFATIPELMEEISRRCEAASLVYMLRITDTDVEKVTYETRFLDSGYSVILGGMIGLSKDRIDNLNKEKLEI